MFEQELKAGLRIAAAASLFGLILVLGVAQSGAPAG